MKTKSNLTEKKLTKAELEAREKVMKDLKKNKSALVKRYGKDAEAVMYGRATNIAKKMAESENKNRIKELVRKSLMQEADIEVGADKYEEEEKLTQASSMLDDLETKLSRHDWFYMMSDDSNKYSQGSAKEREIRDLISKLESMGYGKEAKDMYNEKEPYSRSFSRDSKLKEAKGKDMDKDGDIDSDDYLAARDAAIKKSKLKEYDPDQDQLDDEDEIPMSYDDEGRPLEEKNMSKYKVGDKIKWSSPKGEVEDEIAGIDGIYLKLKSGGSIPYQSVVSEDLDLGHEDDEPHMIKAELYRIGKYAMELYQMVDGFEGKGEVDFPGWWQSKITKAQEMMVSAKHYLDFELKEPAIDAMVGVASDEEILDDESPLMEDEVTKVDRLAAAIQKALNKNKSSEDQNNIKQARKAMNDGNIEAAKKILNPYLAEKLAKQLKSK
jgi:hypothetical protein